MLRNLFGLHGRTSRLAWWMTQLFIVVAGLTYSQLLAVPSPHGVALAGIFLSALWLISECGMFPGDGADNDNGPPTGKGAQHADFAEEFAAVSLARDATTSRMEGSYGTYAAPTPALASCPSLGRPVFGKL